MNLERQKQDLLHEINDAFEDVNRVGGTSWRGAEVEDHCTAPQFVTYVDKDSRWQDLLDDPEWEPAPGVGGFSFLDPIGFRYYLPAAMITSIRNDYDEGICFHLTLPSVVLRQFTFEKWSLLSDRQRQCVQTFIKYMIALSCANENEVETEGWKKAYASYWYKV